MTGTGSDTIDCGPDNDTAYANSKDDQQRITGCERVLEEDTGPSARCGGGGTCSGGDGDDVLDGSTGPDRLSGLGGDDIFAGRRGDDMLSGGDGDDRITGDRGADVIRGGNGKDTLTGGFDRDALYGGPGNDTLTPGSGVSGELVDCGPGRDTAIVGRGDRTRSCEVVRR